MAATKPIREINTRGGRVTLVRASKVNELIRKINALYNIELQPAGLGNIRTSDHNTVIDLRQLNKVLTGDSGQETAQGSGAFTGGSQAGTEGTEYATIADLLQQIQDQQATIDALEEQIEQLSVSDAILHQRGLTDICATGSDCTNRRSIQAVFSTTNPRTPFHLDHTGSWRLRVSLSPQGWELTADSALSASWQGRILNSDRTLYANVSAGLVSISNVSSINALPADRVFDRGILQLESISYTRNVTSGIPDGPRVYSIQREYVNSGGLWRAVPWGG